MINVKILPKLFSSLSLPCFSLLIEFFHFLSLHMFFQEITARFFTPPRLIQTIPPSCMNSKASTDRVMHPCFWNPCEVLHEEYTWSWQNARAESKKDIKHRRFGCLSPPRPTHLVTQVVRAWTPQKRAGSRFLNTTNISGHLNGCCRKWGNLCYLFCPFSGFSCLSLVLLLFFCKRELTF